MLKVDLHNHTFASYDGFNTLDDFEKAHQQGKIDIIAITDHNHIKTAQEFAKKASFPIIVGEEVETQEGDLIGLFLREVIPKGLTIKDTISAIHDQEGLVLAPHPFDFFRIGLSKKLVLENLSQIDLFESLNGAYSSLLFSWYFRRLKKFARQYNLLETAGSDAHLSSDIGRGVVEVPKDSFSEPTPQKLIRALNRGKLVHNPTSVWREVSNIITKRYPKMFRTKIKNARMS